MTAIIEYLQIPLIQNMFIATAVACILCGIVGAYVVVGHMSTATGGIAHTTFGGVGMAYYAMSVYMVGWMTPMLGAFIFATVSAAIIAFCKRIDGLRQDTVIGAIWAVGMASGVIFMNSMDRSVMVPSSFESILFGNVLMIGSDTLLTMIVITVISVAVVVLTYRDLQLHTFDWVQARLSGINSLAADMLLYILVAVSCVIAAKVVGIIMAIALLTMPSAMAAMWMRKLSDVMLVGTVISIILSTCGLLLSLVFDSAPGATVALLMGAAFLVALVTKKVTEKAEMGMGPVGDEERTRHSADPSPGNRIRPLWTGFRRPFCQDNF